MSTNTTVAITRQDPEIEAYRLGLLGDVQGLIRDQIFGQNVQNLREQGLSDAAIAERLDREVGDVSNISQDQIFRPPDYQVAGLSAAEQAALNAASTGIGGYTNYLNTGATSLSSGQGALQKGIAGLADADQLYDPSTVSTFMNPYEDLAVQAAMSDIRDQGELRRSEIGAAASAAGALGGSRRQVREGMLDAEIAKQQARTAAEMRRAGYESAGARSQQAFEDAERRGLQGSQLAGQLGAGLGSLGVQQAGLGELQSNLLGQDIQRLMATGGMERGVSQAGLDALRLSNLQRYSQPYQQFGFLSDIYSGVPTGSSTITTSSMPQVSPFQQIAGLGIAGLSAVSGARQAGLM